MQLFEIAGTPVTIITLLTFILIVVLTFWGSRLVQRAIERGLALRGVKDRGTVGATQRLTHYLILMVGLGVGLQTVGINLSALFAAGAFFAVAIGFALQGFVQNFVSGLTLLVERSVKAGDILSVDGQLLTVVEMRMRTTIARTLEDEDIIIPNSFLVQSSVKNYTLTDSLYRVTVDVGLAYESDLDLVATTLKSAALAVPWRVQAREPIVLLSGFGASSVDYTVAVWVSDPWSQPRYRSDLRKAIWDALKEAKLVIAFPQLDVHFDPSITRLPPAA